MNPASVAGNNSREQFIEWCYVVDLVYHGFTSDQRKNAFSYGNLMADSQLGFNNAKYVGDISLTDSDQMSSNWFGFKLWAIMTNVLGNPRASEYLNAVSVSGISSGGLDATALDKATVRNQFGNFCRQAVGGSWIESSAYNEGTTSLVFEGTRCLYDVTGVDHVPESTRAMQNIVKKMLCAITPDIKYQHVWGDRDAAQNTFHMPNYMTHIGQQGGLFNGYDDIGPVALGLNQYWYTNFSNTRSPYGRFYAQMDPTLTIQTMDTLPVVFNGSQIRREIYHADRSSANGSSFCGYGFSFPGVHHAVEWWSDYLLYRKGERTFRHPEAYGLFSICPDGVNGVLFAGMAVPKSGSSGPVAYDVAENSHVYMRNSAQGDMYSAPAYYNPPPTSWYEITRQYLYIPSSTKNSDVIVDHVRGRGSNPKKLAKFDRYLAPASYNGTVNNSATPTTTTFSATIADRASNGYLNYWISFLTGALAGQFFKVTASSSSAGTTSFTVQTMPQAPSSGDTFTARFGGDYTKILNANALFEWNHHTLVNPTLNSTDTSWQTAGGQYCRVDHLLPVGFQRVVYNETTDFVSTGAVASELKYQFRIYGPTPWPADATSQSIRFLNVVSVADVSNTVASELIQSTVGELADGTHFTRTSEDDVVAIFGSEVASPVFQSGFTIAWTSVASSTSVFLCGLNPRKTWAYTIDGGGSTPISVPESGLAKLTVSGTGLHTFVVSGS